MANLLKKFVAGISTLAILATTAAVPVFAQATVFNVDYTDANAELWPTATNVAISRNDEFGMILDATGNDKRPSASLSIDTISESAVIEYEFMYCGRGDGNSSINFGNVVSLSLNKLDASTVGGSINGTAFSGIPKASGSTSVPTVSMTNITSYWSQSMQVKHVVNMEAKTVDTTITVGNTTYVEETTPFSNASAVSFNSISYSFAKYAAVAIKNMNIYTVDAPSVTMEDVSLLEVGEKVKVATVTNADEVNVLLTNDTDFTYSIEDAIIGYEIYVTAESTAVSGATTTVTISAEKEITVEKSIDLTAKSAEDIVKDVADSLVLSGISVTKKDNDTYIITNSFALPTSSNDNVDVTWRLSSSSYAKVVDNTTVKVTKDPAMQGESLTLTAQITYGAVVLEKEITLELAYQVYDVYYNESFDDFETGTLVNLATGNQSNTTYGDSNGMTFTCGARGEGGGDAVGVIINNLSGTDNYMNVANSNYTGQGRRPIITLTRKISVTNNLVIKADLRFADADDDFLIFDSSSNMLTLNVPADSYAGQWLNYTIIGAGAGKVKILVKDADGKVIDYYTGDSTLKGVATMSLTDTNASTVAVNNLYIADDTETIADADIVAAAKANLDIDDLTHKGGVYTAATDFDLPDDPEGTEVTWTAMQKAKDGSEWEESSFIKVNGTSAVINPTKDIDSYDVKLVATITAGEATDTAEFVIDLPNPMDEINGILDNNFNIVNTTDFDTSLKTITFDLKGEDMLKRDLALPISYKKYENTKIAWTSSDSNHLAIAADGTATVMTSDFNSHDVKLTAVVTYKKGDITYSSDEQVFDLKVGFEADDAESDDETLGKYRVRYDAAYEDNFDIPTASTSNITLPTDGYFGSEFKWTSSAPTIISNAGKLTRPATTRTVTLTADIISGSASGTAEFKVTVQGTSSSGSSGGGGGGGGGGTASTTGVVNKGTSSGTISTPTSTVVVPADITSASDTIARLQEEALAANDLFTDISKAAWARDAINGLAKAGVVNGKSDTEFAPNDTVTRAEFAKMLMGAFGLASDAYTTSSFNDVPTGEWYFQFVESAYNLGIIQGTASGTFEPNALITRQDMAVMVARAAQIAGKDLAAVRDMLGFADGGRIASYAAEAVEQLVKAGAMSGKSDTEFAPLENATRAQAAQILFNLVG